MLKKTDDLVREGVPKGGLKVKGKRSFYFLAEGSFGHHYKISLTKEPYYFASQIYPDDNF